MNFQDTQIGQQVVRSKGDYVVGRIGEIIDKDEIKNRVRVAWVGENRTWVSVNSIEPTFIPYEIIPAQFDKNGRGTSWPVYKRK
jgi:hypothetical protein